MLNKVQETLLVNVAETFTLRQYEDLSAQTAVYPEAGSNSLTAVAYCALGLSGEAGEIALKVAELGYSVRDDDRDSRMKIVAEVGDFLWYVSQLRRELDNAHLSDETFLDYQKKALTCAAYDDNDTQSLLAVTQCSLRLAGRAAEVCNRVKKLMRDGDSKEKRRVIVKFVDDCLLYAPALLHELAEAPFGEVALANIFKIADRQNRGTIHGDGDNR